MTVRRLRHALLTRSSAVIAMWPIAPGRVRVGRALLVAVIPGTIAALVFAGAMSSSFENAIALPQESESIPWTALVFLLPLAAACAVVVGARVARFIKEHDVGMTSNAGLRLRFETIYKEHIVPRRPLPGIEQVAREFEMHRKTMQHLLANMQTALAQAADQILNQPPVAPRRFVPLSTAEAVLRYANDFLPSWAGAISIDLIPVVLVLLLTVAHSAMRRDAAFGLSRPTRYAQGRQRGFVQPATSS